MQFLGKRRRFLRKRMKQASSDFKIISVLLLLILSCIGSCVGISIFHISKPPEWRDLGSPPEKIEKLIVADFDSIYVKTIFGNIYSCTWASPYDIECWVKVNEIPDKDLNSCGDRVHEPAPKPLNRQIIETVKFQYCWSFAGREHYSEFNYYLLENGNVLQWGEDDFHFFEPIGVIKREFLYILHGALFGIKIGLSLIFIYHYYRTKKDQNL
jgi:hypothetical protein